jgi:serine/threonine-protein kinase
MHQVERSTSVDDFLRLWQDLREQRKSPTLEDLCAKCPEQAADLKERLRAVASMMSLLGLEAEMESVGSLSTENLGPAGSSPTVVEASSSLGTGPADPTKSVQISGYEVLDELGRGGTGVVYLARQVRLNRTCALKMILTGLHTKDETVARFLAEAEVIAQLQHPHVVQIYHIGEADGLPFLELEYLQGGSLDRQLDGTPWPSRQATRLSEQLARGIAEAHRLGVVHRDLKPANVLLAPDGTPKISDFGMAKTLGREAGLTQSQAIMGSPTYMAPEQAEGRAKAVGPAADIYALGVILYELLTGRPPFRAASIWETLEQVKTVEPVPPSRLVPKLPRDIEKICLKCLQKEPSRRYSSADALAEDLRRFLEDLPVRARPVPAWERAARWARRKPVHAALLAVVCVAAASLIGGGLWYSARLHEALNEADVGRCQTNLQRKRAEMNFRKAREAVDEMLTQVAQEELADIPRMGPVRERLLGKALAFYQGFLLENGEDQTIRKEVARASSRVAEIQALLRHHPEAEAAYRTAIALCSSPKVPSPDAGDRAAVARYQGELASLLVEVGRYREAAEALDQCTELLEGLRSELPDAMNYNSHLTRVHFTRGRLLLGLRDIDGSRSAYAASVTLGELLVARYPEVADFQGELARGLASLGLLQPDPREADRRFLRAIGLLEKLCEEKPAVARYRHQLGRTLLNRGVRLHGSGALSEAERCYRGVISTYDKLAADFPERPDYREHLAKGHNNLGELLAATGEPAAAERAYRTSLRLKKGLAAAHPDVPDYRSAHGTGLATLGQHLTDSGRLDEGRALVQQAIAEHRAALAKVPSHPNYRDEARKAYEFMAKILGREGDHAALARLAAEISIHPTGDKEEDHLAARFLARCLPLALADGTLTAQRRRELARSYADRAMAALAEAIGRGDRDFRHFQSDDDLAPLKFRDDFGLIMMDLAFPSYLFALPAQAGAVR